jgi:hypothetical protein
MDLLSRWDAWNAQWGGSGGGSRLMESSLTDITDESSRIRAGDVLQTREYFVSIAYHVSSLI